MRPTVVLLLVVLFGASCAREQDSTPSASTLERDRQSAKAAIAVLADDVWQHQLETDVRTRLNEGLPVERLPAPTFAEAEANAAFAQTVLDRLATIDRDVLVHQDALSHAMLEWQSSMEVEGLQYFWHFSALTPYTSPLQLLRSVFGALPVSRPEDRAQFLALLGQVPERIDQVREFVAGKLDRGIVISAANLETAVGLLAAAMQPANAGLFAVPEARFEALDDVEGLARFREQHRTLIEGPINEALERLRAYVDETVRAAAPAGVGADEFPNGDAYYRYLVRYHTTLEITPEEVQAIGYEMVADMEAAMDAIQTEVGFAGSRQAFRDHVMADPRYRAETPDAVGAALMAVAARMEARFDEYFIRRQQAPYGVRRLNPALESSMTYGYYDSPTAVEPTGYYNYNGSKLEDRSLVGATGLSLHELIPGHHYHIARQQENMKLPAFRRYGYPTAYTEGWGSYASYLGFEGLAEGPFEHYGIYALEVFLANRLVVDPGMNAFDMTLEDARAYMAEHTLESDTQIATETLRYSTDMPGQALAYQMGKRTFLALRAKCEKALGEAFDIRRFHEAIIGYGAMPLTVLEGHIDWFIDQEKARG